MSCIRFVGGPVGDGGPPLRFYSPAKSKSKVSRLYSMSVDKNVSIRLAAAGNPMCPEELLLVLSRDESLQVRSWAVRNPNCSDKLLDIVSRREPDAGIRAYAKFELQRRQDVIDSLNHD